MAMAHKIVAHARVQRAQVELNALIDQRPHANVLRIERVLVGESGHQVRHDGAALPQHQAVMVDGRYDVLRIELHEMGLMWKMGDSVV